MSAYDYTTIAPPFPASAAVAINNNNVVLGSSEYSPGYSPYTVFTFNAETDEYGHVPVPLSAAAFPTDINDTGTAVGYYLEDGSLASIGFIYSGGTLTTISAGTSFGYADTKLQAINNLGMIAGTAGTASVFVDNHGTYVYVPLPADTSYADASAINDAGDVVGTYADGQGMRHAFLYDGHQVIDISDPDGTDSQGIAIDNSGEVVGQFVDASGEDLSYIYKNGTFTTLGGPSGAVSVNVLALNDGGEIAGFYNNASDHSVGFVEQNGTYTDISYPGATDTSVVGISDSGDVAGDYTDSSSGRVHAFIAAIACFAEGTKIATDRGDVAVEKLSADEQVVTHDGQHAAIRWIGNRIVECVRHPRPSAVWPVEISADAFGLGLPQAPLRLSPDHAVFIGDALIPVKHLVNGVTIRHIAVDRVRYYHLELERHDVIRAENLPVESYLDTGDRSSFSDCGLTALHPVWGEGRDAAFAFDAVGYAPLVVSGPIVEAVRARLTARISVPRDHEPLVNGDCSDGGSAGVIPRAVRRYQLVAQPGPSR